MDDGEFEIGYYRPERSETYLFDKITITYPAGWIGGSGGGAFNCTPHHPSILGFLPLDTDR